MTNEERIAELEAKIHELHVTQAELNDQLTRAQVDQWQSRIDDLEVQMHLGAMETNERAKALMEQLRTRWSETRAQVEGATSTAASVADTLRNGVEGAIRELRKALLDSKSKLSS